MFCRQCQQTWPYNKSQSCIRCGDTCGFEAYDLLGPTEAQIVGETRPPQLSFAKAIEKAIRTERHMIGEAGTGTGKSLAALLPAVLSGKRVVVSTATIALQAQYYEKDLPFLLAQLADHGVQFSYALAKGRSNYLCEMLYRNLALPDKKGHVALQVPDWLREWEKETVTGDRAEHPRTCPYEIWVKIDAEECPGSKYCSISRECRFVRMRAQLGCAQVVVANHAITGFDIRLGRGVLLPKYSILLLDEAHKAQDAFGNAFTETLTEKRIERLCDDIDQSGVLSTKTFERWNGKIHGRERVEHKIMNHLINLRGANRALFGKFVQSNKSRVPIKTEDIAQEIGEIQTEISALNWYFPCLGHYETSTFPAGVEERLRYFFGAAGDKMDNVDARAFRFVSKLQRLQGTLKYLGEDGGSGDLLFVEFPTKSTKSKLISKRPINIGPILAAQLFPYRQVIAYSATVTVSKSFESIQRDLGFDPAQTDTHIESSPFDYANRAMLYLTKNIPVHPSKDKGIVMGSAAYDAALAVYFEEMSKEMYRLCTQSGGHAFALFTNEKEMLEVVGRFRGLMSPNEFSVIVQGEVSPNQAEREFRSSKRPVLFALKSFWEGVSIEGEQLRMVMIAKVPFPSREDLLYQALRAEYEKKHGAGYAAFMKLDVPRMVMEVVQAAGRLLRTMKDYGVVAILDRKITDEFQSRKSYAAILVRTLPFTQFCTTPGTVQKFLAQFRVMDLDSARRKEDTLCAAENVGTSSNL